MRGLDKRLRLGLGLVLIGLGLFGPIGWWGAIGLVPLATGLLGNRPLCSLLGLNACPAAQRG
ncbi:DUF2892 domain-containing protein [Dankookia sp. GCM10030260]|uniref:YgaP family membrane protein n=1 Tax=Dankookia sp. GCM10030260 TaxID=3273390 RepID=UPI0036090B73